jgi:hypothetical protein
MAVNERNVLADIGRQILHWHLFWQHIGDLRRRSTGNRRIRNSHDDTEDVLALLVTYCKLGGAALLDSSRPLRFDPIAVKATQAKSVTRTTLWRGECIASGPFLAKADKFDDYCDKTTCGKS